MSGGPMNCPLCGETVQRLASHVDTAHSSKFCAKCKICSLKSDPPEETKCMECGDNIGAVKAEPEEPLVIASAPGPSSGSGAVRVRMIPISSLVSVLPTPSASSVARSSVSLPPANILSLQTTSPQQSSNQTPIVKANSLVKQKQPIQCHICGQWFNNKDSNLIHQVLVHALLYCKFCDKVFKTDREKKQHDIDKHHIFSCNQCKQNFSSHKLLVRHRAERHRLFACNLCDYNFNQTDIEAHHAKTHRMLPATVPAFAPESYFDTKIEVITTTGEKMKLKCLLCDKSMLSSKIINHVKYYHNFSNAALLDTFSSGQLQLLLTDGSLEAGAGEEGGALVVRGSANPQEEYNCYKCNAVYRDCGAHLLFQHNMRRCRDLWCEQYFANDEARKRHEEGQHKQEFTCSVCSAVVDSQYGLVVHRFRYHNMQTCVLCDSMILTSLEAFAAHLINAHCIKNRAIVNNAKQFPIVFRLLNSPMLKYDSATMEVECCFCDNLRIDCRNGGEELVRHLVIIHRVKNPSRSVFSLFRGTEFHYHTMANSAKDIVKEVTVSQMGLKQPGGSLAPKNMVLVQRYRLGTLPRSLVAVSGAASPVVVSSNQCIVCKKDFQSSEEVQRHLLSEHITSNKSGEAERDPGKQNEEEAEAAVTELDPLAIKQEDTEKDAVVGTEMTEYDDVEIDEEHFSINNVEVSITESEDQKFVPPDEPKAECNLPSEDETTSKNNPELRENEEEIVIKNELEYEDNIELVDFPESIEKEMTSADPAQDPLTPSKTSKAASPKTPISLKCELCGLVLSSILNFTTHMRKSHRGSEQERNKPFQCDICQQGFYFKSSLNSHKSKAHKETSGATFRCPLCPSVTNSKNGMRRHLRNSHKSTLLNEELSYKCHICSALFWSISERTAHIAEAHKEASDSLEKCHICSHISPNRHALRRHFQRMHPNESLDELADFKCEAEECSAVFQLKSQLAAHIKAEHKPPSVAHHCSDCDREFTTKKSLTRHLLQHKKEECKVVENTKHACEVCHKEFQTRKALRTHFSTSHSEKSKKGFVCKVCNKVLDSANDRSVHYKIDHPESSPYLCHDCGQGFLTKNSLYNHRMCHKKSMIHKCDHCGKEFNRRDSFNEHLLIHVGPRHKCPHCPKEFVQKSNLKRHIRIHLGIKPYKCSFCEMTFSDKGACNSHQRTHTGEEREACPICHVVFSKKQKLKYHMRIHTGEGLETCHLCNKIFTHTYALNVHMKIHSKENNFMCHKCKKVFLNATRLYKHTLVHSKQEFSCQECGKMFKYCKLLNRHVMAKHQNVVGLKCGFEQCQVRSIKLADIREHVRLAHSVKNPAMGTHILDEYSAAPVLPGDIYDENELDLATIYECLDEQIDFDVLRSSNDNTEEEIPEIKEEIKEEEEIPAKAKLKRKRTRNTATQNNYELPESSGVKTRTKRKRTESGERLIVRIRNRKEKLAAAAAVLQEIENDEVSSESDEIKTEPV